MTDAPFAKADGANGVIHPTAVVDAGARIGAGTKVWHFCHVSAGASIGDGCVLGQNVYVADRVVVGDRCRIQNNVSLYDGVVLEEDVFVGPSVVFTNVRRPRAFLPRKHEFLSTRIRRGCTVGANATIVCGVSVGAYSLVAAGAVVTRDVAAHALVRGAPARQVGWVCRCGQDLVESREAVRARWSCPECGESYPRLDDTARARRDGKAAT